MPVPYLGSSLPLPPPLPPPPPPPSRGSGVDSYYRAPVALQDPKDPPGPDLRAYTAAIIAWAELREAPPPQVGLELALPCEEGDPRSCARRSTEPAAVAAHSEIAADAEVAAVLGIAAHLPPEVDRTDVLSPTVTRGALPPSAAAGSPPELAPLSGLCLSERAARRPRAVAAKSPLGAAAAAAAQAALQAAARRRRGAAARRVPARCSDEARPPVLCDAELAEVFGGGRAEHSDRDTWAEREARWGAESAGLQQDAARLRDLLLLPVQESSVCSPEGEDGEVCRRLFSAERSAQPRADGARQSTVSEHDTSTFSGSSVDADGGPASPVSDGVVAPESDLHDAGRDAAFDDIEVLLERERRDRALREQWAVPVAAVRARPREQFAVADQQKEREADLRRRAAELEERMDAVAAAERRTQLREAELDLRLEVLQVREDEWQQRRHERERADAQAVARAEELAARERDLARRGQLLYERERAVAERELAAAEREHAGLCSACRGPIDISCSAPPAGRHPHSEPPERDCSAWTAATRSPPAPPRSCAGARVLSPLAEAPAARRAPVHPLPATFVPDYYPRR
eukprot:TRINITY_DN19125_c1_g1_i1.p1 TRINITY_DN19125_c1_g1~~TRINITY_DN19125_c1_g1_i1.p1  ORF type:complete len:600 (+),score=141.80 TRINITY_DN19125_c1_g1_i1:71-1801(+)